MVGRERERGILAGGSRREQVSQAPVWLSRTDSASSNSSYGGGSRPMSYGSVGEGFDDDQQQQQQQQQFSRFATQPQPRPRSGRRALPPAPLSPMSTLHGTPGSGVSQQPMPFQTHENDHDRRPIHMPRPPAAAGAAAQATSSLASEQVVPLPTNKHQTTNPKPQTPNPKPQTPNLNYSRSRSARGVPVQRWQAPPTQMPLIVLEQVSQLDSKLQALNPNSQTFNSKP